MDKWQKRNERLALAEREEKLKKSKEKNKKIREATEKLSKWQKPSTSKCQHKSPKM